MRRGVKAVKRSGGPVDLVLDFNQFWLDSIVLDFNQFWLVG